MTGNGLLQGGDGEDRLFAGIGNSRLEGGIGNDILVGGTGNDTLVGGSERDLLQGDPAGARVFGNDRLDGGTGNDLLMGGGGADVFVFRASGGADTVGRFDVDWLNPGATAATAEDFTPGLDRIEFETGTFASAADVYAATQTVGGSAVINSGWERIHDHLRRDGSGVVGRQLHLRRGAGMRRAGLATLALLLLAACSGGGGGGGSDSITPSGDSAPGDPSFATGTRATAGLSYTGFEGDGTLRGGENVSVVNLATGVVTGGEFAGTLNAQRTQIALAGGGTVTLTNPGATEYVRLFRRQAAGSDPVFGTVGFLSVPSDLPGSGRVSYTGAADVLAADATRDLHARRNGHHRGRLRVGPRADRTQRAWRRGAGREPGQHGHGDDPAGRARDRRRQPHLGRELLGRGGVGFGAAVLHHGHGERLRHERRLLRTGRRRGRRPCRRGRPPGRRAGARELRRGLSACRPGQGREKARALRNFPLATRCGTLYLTAIQRTRA